MSAQVFRYTGSGFGMTAVPDYVPEDLVRRFDYHHDPDFLADPFAAFDRIRDRRVFFSPVYGGYWVLTRAEDIRRAFQDPQTFSSREFSIPSGVYPRTLRPLALDPPDHGTTDSRWLRCFAPRPSPSGNRLCGRCALTSSKASPARARRIS